MIIFRHEDIRDAMLSLVHMLRASEDKLERHEFREKALGEQLKKALAGLDKRHRSLDPLKGAISRLDERLSNVETILIQVKCKTYNKLILSSFVSFYVEFNRIHIY